MNVAVFPCNTVAAVGAAVIVGLLINSEAAAEVTLVQAAFPDTITLYCVPLAVVAGLTIEIEAVVAPVPV